ncbi:hypothetical protein [Sporomusa malonica]|uniref:Uncharacterized protein n=1 Tax=Sporomusa malonica TaxID=112901 RepID=A0A1W2EHT3_9FIRM|nr:hypothetical protein [Sporomusa malonica]SMD09263.1 hypothetical protein SAMN04488500_12462 [Sporomusa malonica]
MLASYDKIIKYVVEKIQAALSPLEQMTKNQEIMIAQNKQIIDLLAKLNNNREPDIVPDPASSSSETVSDAGLSSEVQS